MTERWLWIGTVLDMALFLVGLYLAMLSFAVLGMSDRGVAKYFLLFAVIALPVACILCPARAWNLYDRGNIKAAATLMFAPMLYALFVTVAMNGL